MDFKNFLVKNIKDNYNFFRYKFGSVDSCGNDKLINYIRNEGHSIKDIDKKEFSKILGQTKINHENNYGNSAIYFCISTYRDVFIGGIGNYDKFIYILEKILERGDNPYLKNKNPNLFYDGFNTAYTEPIHHIINGFFRIFLVIITKIKLNSKILEYFIDDIYNTLSNYHEFEILSKESKHQDFNLNLDKIIDNYIDNNTILELQHTINIRGKKITFGEFLRKINKYDKIKNYYFNKCNFKFNNDRNISLIILNYLT